MMMAVEQRAANPYTSLQPIHECRVLAVTSALCRRLMAASLLAGLMSAMPVTAPFVLSQPDAEISPGVTPDRVVFGQSAALDGPAAQLGRDMRDGILAAFHEVDAAGGVNGRRLELISYDDGYEPESAIANTHRLIGEDRVFALIGPVGTPTSIATAPIAVDAGVPLIGPFTGAEFLRAPEMATVINLRASYHQEAERIVDWLTTDFGVDRIAVLYQDDSFGRSGLDGVRAALARRGLDTVAEGSYPRNTTAVKRALLAIRRGAPQAVVIVGAYEPSAEFTRWARVLGLDALFVNVSFVGSNALASALGPAPAGTAPDTYISQVVPPLGSALPLIEEYRAAMAAAHGPGRGLGFVSLEGYLAGRLAAAILANTPEPPTRAGFLAASKWRPVPDIGGFALRFGPFDNQGSDAVFLTVIDPHGEVVALDEAPR